MEFVFPIGLHDSVKMGFYTFQNFLEPSLKDLTSHMPLGFSFS